MQKAITPVVSIVLLSLMTVGAAVLAFVWIGSVQGNIQETAGGAITSTAGSSCSRLNIISMRGDGVTVSNVGCDTIGNVTLLINGELTDYDLDSPLGPGEAVFISYANLPKSTDGCVDIVLEGGQVVQECTSAGDATNDAGFADQCTEDVNCIDSNPCTNNICSDGVCNYPSFSDGPQTGCTGSTGCAGSFCECVSGVCIVCINNPPCQEEEGDCTGGDSTWKMYMRQAFDNLAGELDQLYLDICAPLVSDAWKLRDRYIYVMTGQMSLEELLAEMAVKDLSTQEQQRLSWMLEAQRLRQQMYASCGWFFEDFDRIEPRNNVVYAASAVYLAELASGVNLGRSFAEILKKVNSERGGLNAQQVFEEYLEQERERKR